VNPPFNSIFSATNLLQVVNPASRFPLRKLLANIFDLSTTFSKIPRKFPFPASLHISRHHLLSKYFHIFCQFPLLFGPPRKVFHKLLFIRPRGIYILPFRHRKFCWRIPIFNLLHPIGSFYELVVSKGNRRMAYPCRIEFTFHF
jgi:hypothetical protein